MIKKLWSFKRSSVARQERLRFRCPFVPAAGDMLNNLAGPGIRVIDGTRRTVRIHASSVLSYP